MQAPKHIMQFVLIALLVAIIGGFGGWYFFIQKSLSDTSAADIGRGAGENTVFGSPIGSTYQNISTTETGTSSAGEIGKRAPRLWHVTSNPVAGFGFAADSAAMFFAERATGNVLKANPDGSSVTRLTNTLIPKIHEAVFSRTGDVILRTINEAGDITTFAATIATTTDSTAANAAPNVLQGVYLDANISTVVTQVHPSTSKGIFFIARNPEGGSIAATADWKGAAVKKVLLSPLTQWRAQWLSDGRFVITQNASDGVAGYSFIVSAAGAMKPLVSNVAGLTVHHHPSSDAYLYGSSDRGAVALYVKKSASSDPVLLPIETTADKCVWAPGAGLIAYCAVPSQTSASYLADWYQGAAHSTDTWWKIDASAGTAERFFVTDSRISLDVENPSIDLNGTHLGFQNATDKSLWLLRVAE